MAAIGLDHFLAVAAIVVTSILVLLCFTTGKRGDDGRDGDAASRRRTKSTFTLPPMKEDGGSGQRLMDRLGLARTNGCVVTLALSSSSSSGGSSSSGSSRSSSGSSGSGARVLAALASVANVFLIVKAQSTDEEERIWNDLRNDPAVAPLGLARHRVLFHETTVGKVAIVRQLRPQLHIDFDADVCGSVAPHIKTVVEYKGHGPRASVADAAHLAPCADKRGNTWGSVAHLEDVLSITTVAPAPKARQ